MGGSCPDPGEIRELFERGAYAEALDAHLGLYEHPQTPEGVRLSEFLQWSELAAVYPPALGPLVAIRERRAESLRSGSRDWHEFHEVATIDRALSQPARTCELFREIEASDPSFTRECASIAVPAMVEAREFDLALALVPSPREALRREARDRLDLISRLRTRGSEERAIASLTRGYARNVEMFAAILAGTGKPEEAERLRREAPQWIETGTGNLEASGGV